MAGRLAAGILAATCLLLPRILFAQAGAPGGEEQPVTREELERINQRIEELETGKTATEDATRSIIRQSLSTLGSKINELVTLGGTFELGARWQEFFGDPRAGIPDGSDRAIRLNTTEIDFEIQANDWTLGSIIFQYDNGSDAVFTTIEQDEVSVDRINLDTAFLTIGDTTRFWAFGRFGRMIVPFGISTGAPVADVLTLDNPLTIDVFESKEDAFLVGVEFPTPPLVPPAAPTANPPRVRPMLLNPLVSGIARSVGFQPFPTPPPAPTLTTPALPTPPFNAGIYFYDGDTHTKFGHKQWTPTKQFGATLGYREKVICRPYQGQQPVIDEPRPHWLHFFCPWSVAANLDFNRSVFDSNFLGFEYRNFLDQIEFVPGMAANIKSNLGPISLVAEWNGALSHATFLDDNLNFVSIMPRVWQVSLGYQFDWNPWVEKIGAQGTYLALSYSQSRDLAGITRVLAGGESRIAFVPRKRWLVTLGEWVLDGTRVAIEYSRNVDYPKRDGGTGKTANGIFTMLTYEW